jgi:hypothetical protein
MIWFGFKKTIKIIKKNNYIKIKSKSNNPTKTKTKYTMKINSK